MKASIIIPTYNNAEALEKTLFSLTKQTIDLNEIEVLICDDGSSDDTKEVCSEYSSKLNLSYFFQEDKGFRAAAARNIGIKNAKSDLCIFIDTGLILSSDNIENHIKIHKKEEKPIAVIGYIYGFDDNNVYDEIVKDVLELDSIDKSIEMLAEKNVVDVREKIYREMGDNLGNWPAPWIVCWSSNLSVRKDILYKVGMFDEAYHSWGGEDTDLALALYTFGVEIKLCRACKGIELPSEKLNMYDTNPEKAEEEFCKKRDYMNKKYNLTSIKVWYEKRYDELNQELLKRSKEKISIIWDVTRRCVWNCKICCASAIYYKSDKQINTECNPDFSFDGELNLKQKKRIIDMLVPGKCRIDFSGGEVLLDASNLKLIEYAAEKLGKDSIGISTSGVFLDNVALEVLSKSVKDVELTLDCIPLTSYNLRPTAYHSYIMYAVKRLKEYNISVGVQTVLTKKNMSEHVLKDLYKCICENDIDTWSILRFFPVGRGAQYPDNCISHEECKKTVEYIKNLTKENKKLDVDFHYLLPNHAKHTHECRCVKRSIGILPNGKVIACFWALNDNMDLLDEKFLLGKLPEQSIKQILEGKKAIFWKKQQHTCSIFADCQ